MKKILILNYLITLCMNTISLSIECIKRSITDLSETEEQPLKRTQPVKNNQQFYLYCFQTICEKNNLIGRNTVSEYHLIKGPNMGRLQQIHVKNALLPQINFSQLATLIGYYKLHLMPKPEDLMHTLYLLADALQHDSIFMQKIAFFKYRNPKASIYDAQQKILPVIVIYPIFGKHTATYVAKKLYGLFHAWQGNGHTPRYNAPIHPQNDFIFYAQGDGDYKNDPKLNQFFEQPTMVHYRADITGSYQDYRIDITKPEPELEATQPYFDDE